MVAGLASVSPCQFAPRNLVVGHVEPKSAAPSRCCHRGGTTKFSELLEREGELAAIETAVRTAGGGRGSGLLFAGEAGIGKTSILAAATARGRELGMRVLRGRGEGLERDFPWGVTVQLFAPIARERNTELFSGAAGLARGLLEGAAPRPDLPADAFPLLHGLHWLTVNVSERAPLLILLDDAHWSDAESLRYLNYLLGWIEELAVCMIVTERLGEPPEPDNAEQLAQLRAHRSISTHALKPLGSEAVSRLVRTELPGAAAELCSAIEELTGGNPFLTRELALAAREDDIEPSAGQAQRLREIHPEAIRSSILVRLGRLGEDAGRLASAAAILGPEASPRLGYDLAGLDGSAGVEAADSLIVAGILEGRDRLSFVHPIVREVVYADIAPQRRASQHLAAARLLHESGAPVEEVASQLMNSEPVAERWARSALRKAAARAAATGAPGSAARLLGQALAAPNGEDPGLLFELGEVETMLGDSAAIGHLEAAASLAPDARQRGTVLAKLAAARYAAGDTDGVVGASRSALGEIPPGRGGSVEAELLFNYGMTGRAVPVLVEDVVRLVERSRSGPDGEPTPGEVVRLMLVGFDALLRGDHRLADERLRQTREHLADERLSRDVPVLAQITLEELRGALGDPGEAERAASGQVDAARGRGNRLEVAIALEARAAARWFGGDLPGARGDAELALSHSEGAWDAATVVLRVIRALVLLERDEPDAAEQSLDIPDALEDLLPGSWGWFMLPVARGRVALARGDCSAARDQALLAGDRLLAVEAPTAGFLSWRPLAAQAAARLGERDQALALAREELERGRAGGAMASTIGIALANLGSLEGGEAGLEILRECVVLLEASSARLEHARALVELGAALRRAGWVRDARESLREGLERARACEARALADRGAEELVAAGARPRRPALSGVESLTPSERRIAEMAAQGLSNREIAEALFVTRRTVETHLTHTYSKLGIRSREELPGILTDRPTGSLPGRSPGGLQGRTSGIRSEPQAGSSR